MLAGLTGFEALLQLWWGLKWGLKWGWDWGPVGAGTGALVLASIRADALLENGLTPARVPALYMPHQCPTNAERVPDQCPTNVRRGWGVARASWAVV